LTPDFTYALSVSQAPRTSVTRAGLAAGTLRNILPAVEAGTFSEPPPPRPLLPSVAPLLLLFVESWDWLFLSLPLSWPDMYQRPPPMIRATATTAAMMMRVWLPPPLPGVGGTGMGCWG